MGANTNFAAFTIHQVRDRYNVQNPLVAAYVINPYEPEFNPDGSYNPDFRRFPDLAQAIYDNPAYSETNTAQGAYYLAVSPIKGLVVKSQIGLNYVDQSAEAYTEPGSYLDLILNGVPTGIKSDGDPGNL